MKRGIVLLLGIMMVLSLCACGSAKESGTAEVVGTDEIGEIISVANPVTESSQKGVMEETGIDLPAPQGAVDVVYSIISMEDKNPIAQMDYVLDGQNYCMRVQSASFTEIKKYEDPAEAGDALKEDGVDISGIYETWTSITYGEVSGRTSVCCISDNGTGYIAWLDAAPGFIYNISMTENATQEALTAAAENSFVPMQGEAE